MLVDVGQRCAAEQLIAAAVALGFVLVLEVAFEGGGRIDLPVGRACAHGAPAVGVVHVGDDAFAGEIHARAHLLPAAEEMAEVDGAVRRAAMIGGEIDGLDVGGALGDVVDEAARRGHAAFDRGNAFEELDLLLVFKRHILLAGDGHAVDFKSGGEIEGKSANLVVAVVAHGHVVVADRGIVLDHIREQARNLVVEQVARDDGGRKRRLLERRAVERADGDGFGKIVVFDSPWTMTVVVTGAGFCCAGAEFCAGLCAVPELGLCGAVCAARGRGSGAGNAERQQEGTEQRGAERLREGDLRVAGDESGGMHGIPLLRFA